MFKFICFTTILVLIFTSCKKPETVNPGIPDAVNTPLQSGLPADSKNINGYLFAAISNTSFTSMYAVFADPGTNLMSTYDRYNHTINGAGPDGNVDVLSVSFNGQNLFRQLTNSRVFYTSSTSAMMPVTGRWKTSGNSTFKAMDVTLERPFPTCSMGTFTTNYVSKSAGFTLDLSTMVNNFDSAIVVLSYGNTSITRRYTSAAIVSFSASDLSPFVAGSSLNLYLHGFSYSYQTINSKVYLFELGNQSYKYLYLNS